MGAEIPLLKPFEMPVLLRAVNRALGLGGAGQGPPEPPPSSH
jgi:hypothetical protein